MDHLTRLDPAFFRKHKPLLAVICLLTLYFAANIAVFVIQPSLPHRWLPWNSFLAMLPFLFAWLFTRCRRKALRTGLAVFWGLFFPNALYLLTDLIHARPTYDLFGERLTLAPWLSLMQVGLSLFLTTTMGLWSLRVMHRALRSRFCAATGWAFVAVACAASGYAVYLGRFARLNSWDVFEPIRLLRRALSYTDGFALRFSAAFAAYIFCAYCVFLVFGALCADPSGKRRPGERRSEGEEPQDK